MKDEPTVALTGAEAERLFAALETLRAAGRAILYVSHRMVEVLRRSERVTVLRDSAHGSTLAMADTSRDQIIRGMSGRDFSNLFRPAETAPPIPLPEVRNLSSAIRPDVSFQVRAAEILRLAALSGSGRNSLLPV